MLPGVHVFELILSFTMHNFWRPWFMMLISHTLSSTIIFVVIKSCLKNFFDARLKHSRFYRFVLHEGKNNPISVGLLIRSIGILNYALKNLICSLGGLGYFSYMITYVPMSMLSATLYIWIGSNLKKADEMFSKNSWSKMNPGQRVTYVLTIFFLALTVAVICFMGFYAKRKLDAFEDQNPEVTEEKVNDGVSQFPARIGP